MTITRLTRLFPLPLLLALAAASRIVLADEACQTIAGDWITGSDLARVVPALGGLPPDLPVSYAPVPGLQRIFHPDELRRLATAHGLEDPHWKTNLCFVWPLAPLSRDAIRTAMEKTLEGRNPLLEILNESQVGAPAGELIFPLSGLSAVSDKPVVWKGYVAYASHRRFNIWVSVRIRIRETRMLANGPLHYGERITAAQCRAQNYEGPLTRGLSYAAADQVAGLVARRDIADGSVLLDGMFESAKDVERGDLVTVLVENGNARIETQGVAERAGRRGEVIVVRNPRSGVKYKARIEDPAKVLVVPGGAAGLVVDGETAAPAPALHTARAPATQEKTL